ncbi:putative ATP-dependent helicase/deoxyribonuclease subunit B [Lactobacillus iners LactinV 01V1-a]|uniref:Putative ATP-dependent helicase/deoxyribonuclease subunit B n=1 Tax=Lactobacillus iners LactinV 01V1-a TaxID=879297 RepID=E1NRE3_9LACO|nr:putative ATP-dependent helicase/deoxyribonuclease subunit B [Lactobacillus iners LactinV 01V1-a]
MINIITSTQAYDLQNEILNMAVKTYLNNKTKKTFVIVPNHVKFTTEIATLKKIANINKQDSVSVTNLQVLSFSRLAWYFLRNQKIALPEIIDDATSLMILEKIVKNKKDELLLFNNFNNGSLKQIYESIILIHQGNVDLNSISHETVTEETSRKLHDLKIIYDEFIQMLGDHFTTKDGIQLILKTVLDKKLSIDNLNFFFCGFFIFFIIRIKYCQNNS